MSLLIDADFIVYKCCAASETEIDFGEDLIVVTSKFTERRRAATKGSSTNSRKTIPLS